MIRFVYALAVFLTLFLLGGVLRACPPAVANVANVQACPAVTQQVVQPAVIQSAAVQAYAAPAVVQQVVQPAFIPAVAVANVGYATPAFGVANVAVVGHGFGARTRFLGANVVATPFATGFGGVNVNVLGGRRGLFGGRGAGVRVRVR